MKSTGGFKQRDGSPCSKSMNTAGWRQYGRWPKYYTARRGKLAICSRNLLRQEELASTNVTTNGKFSLCRRVIFRPPSHTGWGLGEHLRYDSERYRILSTGNLYLYLGYNFQPFLLMDSVPNVSISVSVSKRYILKVSPPVLWKSNDMS